MPNARPAWLRSLIRAVGWIDVGDVTVVGMIDFVTPQDVSVVITSHGAGRRNGTHVPAFAMYPVNRLALYEGNQTTAITPRVQSSRAIGLALATLAGIHQVVIASAPTNDDFMHLVIADQILAGDWPFRDFFDLYGPFMYGASAFGQLLFGHRLLSEAVVVGVALAISTYLVFRLVRSLTGSSAAAEGSDR